MLTVQPYVYALGPQFRVTQADHSNLLPLEVGWGQAEGAKLEHQKDLRNITHWVGSILSPDL